MTTDTEFDLAEEGPEGMLSLIAGAGLGIVIGAALALAYAPHPGSVTRREVAKAVERLRRCVSVSREPLEEDWES